MNRHGCSGARRPQILVDLAKRGVPVVYLTNEQSLADIATVVDRVTRGLSGDEALNVDFLHWMLMDGQRYAEPLACAPLPKAVLSKELKVISQIE